MYFPRFRHAESADFFGIYTTPCVDDMPRGARMIYSPEGLMIYNAMR